ncbi:hypothetical protein F2Q69_00059384 [Brassica cretica]|uniref:Uncharacterized protein n=1 Tax=Brassica cretica TaxID=69181 RepID=A0A8S9RCW1_BRACR|nr:hypothetical protein F2Q69_00059384 [Brassica cretica]
MNPCILVYSLMLSPTIQWAEPKRLVHTERSFRLVFPRPVEPEPQAHESKQRPEQKRMEARCQLDLVPSRLCDELVSLRRKGNRRRKLAPQRREPETELGRWPRPSQRRNFSCHLGKRTS